MAAHERGLPVTAHVQGHGQAERAVGAGIDEFAHTPWTERLSDLLLVSAARSMRIVSTLDIFSFGDVTPDLRTACDNLVRFREAGGTVVYGTDLGNGAIPAGIHVREALLLHEAVRMSPEEVLVAMTAGPLAVGGPADLLVLGSDPLLRLEALGDLRVVVRSGRVVSG
jgi:imidazolonepropionase-like amidohydrolase